MNLKKCTQCKVIKPITEYSFLKREKSHRASECKACHNKRSRAVWLKNLYGLTPEKYEAMYLRQEGRCGLCGNLNLESRGLHVDHNHVTGKIRSLLCGNCNRGLGMFKENIPLLYIAAEYLEKYSCKASKKEN